MKEEARILPPGIRNLPTRRVDGNVERAANSKISREMIFMHVLREWDLLLRSYFTAFFESRTRSRKAWWTR